MIYTVWHKKFKGVFRLAFKAVAGPRGRWVTVACLSRHRFIGLRRLLRHARTPARWWRTWAAKAAEGGAFRGQKKPLGCPHDVPAPTRQLVVRTVPGQAARLVHDVYSGAPYAPSHFHCRKSLPQRAPSNRSRRPLMGSIPATSGCRRTKRSEGCAAAAARSRGVRRHAGRPEFAHREEGGEGGEGSGAVSRPLPCEGPRRVVTTFFRRGTTAGAIIQPLRASVVGRRLTWSGAMPSGQSNLPATMGAASRLNRTSASATRWSLARSGGSRPARCNTRSASFGCHTSRDGGPAGSRLVTRSRTLCSQVGAS